MKRNNAILAGLGACNAYINCQKTEMGRHRAGKSIPVEPTGSSRIPYSPFLVYLMNLAVISFISSVVLDVEPVVVVLVPLPVSFVSVVSVQELPLSVT